MEANGSQKEQNGTRLKRPLIKMIFFGGLALCAVIIITLIVYFWKFSGYVTEVGESAENTLIYSYYAVDDNILKCASDSATLVDRGNNEIWTVSYDMSEPACDVCGDKIYIYDKLGSEIVICDGDGLVSEFSTELPVVKAEGNSSGSVVAICDDGGSAEINYYDDDGSLIAAIKTTMSNNGYPMDIALSDDGVTLLASFITVNQGVSETKLVFYSFDAAGQELTDNTSGSFVYDDEIAPDVEYLSEGRFAAFGTNNIYLYATSGSVKLQTEIEAEDEIESVFADEQFFGYTMQGNDYTGHEIVIFDSIGREKSRIECEFSYTGIDTSENLILLYNRNGMEVYTSGGALKYRGETDGIIRQVVSLGTNRFALALTDGFSVIRLN